jgi:hypothetical protein
VAVHPAHIEKAWTSARAATRCFPVPPGLAELLPDGGIRGGSAVAVQGSTYLALALASRASASGWCAAVGATSLGVLCAAELGFDLARFAIVRTDTAARWTRATTALLDGCDIVLAWPPPSLGLKPAERLIAIARERGAALVLAGNGWPARIDVTLSVTRTQWIGVERGTGRLRARLVEVAVNGRGAAARERRAVLWLPNARGEIALAGEMQRARGRDSAYDAGRARVAVRAVR